MTENDLVAQTTDGQRRSDRGPKTDVRFSRVRLSRNSSVFDGPPDVPNQSGSMGGRGVRGRSKLRSLRRRSFPVKFFPIRNLPQCRTRVHEYGGSDNSRQFVSLREYISDSSTATAPRDRSTLRIDQAIGRDVKALSGCQEDPTSEFVTTMESNGAQENKND